ncbi:EXS family-domain-containing protein [Scheffersomyces coipomensis]|uniref:EXS family-domain-containing protein n=1 Tax=Scheffersomyces coipomensis TaxID=1788519 RepID=UPI00315DA916
MEQEIDFETPTHELLFDDLIPLPFKILFIIQFGTFLWFLLVYLLYNFTNINVLRLLDLSYNSHNYSQLDGETTINNNGKPVNANHNLDASSGEFKTNLPPDFKENHLLLNGIWNNLKAITLINFLTWSLFKFVQYFYEQPIEHDRKKTILTEMLTPLYYILPISAFSYLFYRLFYKSRVSALNHKGQIRIYTTMTRILVGGINSVSMRTNDILISDSLTSYAKVGNDFGLFFWNYYYSDEVSYNIQLEFVILCIPTFIRIKQCWCEFKISRKSQHLLNLLKYTTALGPLLINLLIKYHLTSAKNVDDDDLIQQALLKRVESLNTWWYFFSFINSAYSFIWDVKMDWNLELFDSIINPRKPFHMLRDSLAFKFTGIYIFIIIFDFLFRFVWVLKLFIITDKHESQTNLHVFSTFLFGYDVFSFGYTVLETIEIIRRWLWCFLKLESDWVKLDAVNYIDIELASSSNKRDI